MKKYFDQTKQFMLTLREIFQPLHCDSFGCKNKVYKTMVDMTDGCWIDLCRKHYRSYKKEGYPIEEVV